MAFDSSVKTLWFCNFNLDVNISEIKVIRNAQICEKLVK